MSTPEDLSIETLADYAEGLLGEAETAAVEALLATSPQAQADLDLLTSVTQILKSDEVGAMPAEYAARIDATLAELARTEPIAAVPAPPAAALAPVIDLASRRREVWVGTRRVGSVAASLVLVIGGAAIGVQVLNTESDAPPPIASAPEDSIEVVNLGRYVPKEAPKRAVKGKDGSKIDKKTGDVYLKDGRVLYDNGTVAIPGKAGRPNTIILGPGLTADPALPSRSDVRVMTAKNPRPIDPNAEKTRATSAPAASKTAASSIPETSSEPSAPPASTQAVPSSTGPDPYVGNTGAEYTKDNFAALVRVLLEESGEYAPAGTAGAGEDPAQPAQESVSEATQNRAASAALRSGPAMRPIDRGPGSKELQERVRRCATQLGTTAIAGDAGIWKGVAATIVVVPNPESDKQVIGYVFYGQCAPSEPVMAGNAQWIQPVGKPIAPAPAPAPEPTVEPVVTETVSRSDST